MTDMMNDLLQCLLITHRMQFRMFSKKCGKFFTQKTAWHRCDTDRTLLRLHLNSLDFFHGTQHFSCLIVYFFSLFGKFHTFFASFEKLVSKCPLQLFDRFTYMWLRRIQNLRSLTQTSCIHTYNKEL